jgi:hypothetical protein
MPPFRVVTRHPDEDHKDSAPAAVGGVFDDREDVEEFLTAAAEADVKELRRRNISIPVEKRVRKRDHDQLAELKDLGHEYEVQELHVTEWGTDDADQPVPVAHEWRSVE